MASRPFLFAGVLLFAAAAAAQDSPIKSARISMAPRTIAVERITLENRRDSQLVAFRLGIFRPGAATPAKTYWADYTFDGVPTSGAIAAHGRRSIDVDMSDEQEATSVALMLAQYADGHCEGHVPEPDSGFKLRMPCANTTGRVTSATVTSQRSTSSKTVALVENLRNIPLEAFGFEVVTNGTATVAGTTSDYCGVPHDVPAPFGPIQPQESRELPLPAPVAEGAELRLTFVLFDDLMFEGVARHRDDVLRKREQKAAAHAFAIAALQEAAALPEADVIPFLERKRAEWIRQARTEGIRTDDATALYDAIAEARRQPKTFSLFVRGFVEMLEATRQDLLRHQQSS